MNLHQLVRSRERHHRRSVPCATTLVDDVLHVVGPEGPVRHGVLEGLADLADSVTVSQLKDAHKVLFRVDLTSQ